MGIVYYIYYMYFTMFVALLDCHAVAKAKGQRRSVK